MRLAAAGVLAMTALVLTWEAPTAARELKPETLAGWEKYIALTEARMARELAGESPFLWVDRQPEAERRRHLAALGRGEIVVSKLETRDGEKELDVKSGLIHHWIGTVLLPGTTLDRAIAFVQDYRRYPDRFSPLIQWTNVVSRSPDRFVVRMRTSMKKMMVTVVLEGDYAIDYRRVSPSRVYTRNVAANLAQIHDAGGPGERAEPVDKGSGWLWRIATYCSFEERPDGTYEQCESASLTRGIPFAVSWIVKPFVSGIPRESLEFTLGGVRSALGPGVTPGRR